MWKIGIRFSADLVHWTECKYIVQSAPDWNGIHVNYPIFLSNDGWSNTEIDIRDFYIIGTGPGVNNVVNKIHFQASTSGDFATSYLLQARGLQNSLLPNPTHGLFMLNYQVDSISAVEITMYSYLGQQMGWWRSNKKPGRYREEFDITKYPTGIYLVAVRMRNRYNVYRILKQ